MSNKLQGQVWDMRGLPAFLKFPLVRLADHANSEGYCWPGYKKLSEDLEVSERSVATVMALLDRLGLVEVVRRRRRGTKVYQLHLPSVDVDWAYWLTRVKEDPKLHLGHGWFSDDDPQVPGQTGLPIDPPIPTQDRKQASTLSPDQDRKSTSGQGETQDMKHDRKSDGQDMKPTSSKTGSPLHVPKENLHRTPTKNRARATSTETYQQELRELALERAVRKGAHNPEGLAARILEEDYDQLVDELEKRRESKRRGEAIAACSRCDQYGFRWNEPDNTNIICSHLDIGEAAP